MNYNRLNTSQATALLCVFLCSSLGDTNGMRSGGFAPLALLCAGVGALLPVCVFSFALGKTRSKNIFDSAKQLLPYPIWIVFSVLLILSAVTYASVSLLSFTSFIGVTTLPETPPIIIAIAVCVVSALIVKSGLNTAGKCGQIFLAFIIITTALSAILTLSTGEISSFYDNFRTNDFIRDGVFVFCSSFCKTTIFLGAVSYIKGNHPKKVVWRSTYGALLIIGATMIRDLATIGSKVCSFIDYPSYYAMSDISVFDFLQRIEVISTINALLFCIIDITVCIFCACIGLSRVSNTTSARDYAMPLGLVIAGITASVSRFSDFGFYIVFAIVSVTLALVVATVGKLKNSTH